MFYKYLYSYRYFFSRRNKSYQFQFTYVKAILKGYSLKYIKPSVDYLLWLRVNEQELDFIYLKFECS